MSLRSCRAMLKAEAFCSLCLFLAPAATGRQAESPITLRLKFKQGQVIKYQRTARLTVTMQAIGLPGRQSGGKTFSSGERSVSQMKVVRVKPDGAAEVASTTLSEQQTQGGKTQDITPEKTPVATLTYSQQGMLLALKSSPQSDPIGSEAKNALAALQIGSELLPSQPVRPGDSWTQTVPITVLPGTGPVTIQSQFVKIVTLGRYRTALIHSQVTVPLGAQPARNGEGVEKGGTASGTFDHHFAIAEGRSVRNIGTGSLSFTVRTRTPKGNPVKVQVKMKFDLTKALLPG